jgi:hypothetical protein
MVGEKQLGIHGSPKKPLCWDVEDKDARNFWLEPINGSDKQQMQPHGFCYFSFC